MMTSSDRDALRSQLIAHEGMRLRPYTDTAGKITIGCGRNLTDRGISDAEARLLLDNDITDAIHALVAFPWFPDLDAVRQRAFVDLCFNMGAARLRTFAKMLDAAARHDWATASAELLDSVYAQQVGVRAHEVAAMLRSGAA